MIRSVVFFVVLTAASAQDAPPGGWNFRNHVMPVLTKAGCNQGACHGALAGKGGFKLSLRGYDPELDYDVLTRQSVGRRVNLAEPGNSRAIGPAAEEGLAVDHSQNSDLPLRFLFEGIVSTVGQ